LYLNSPVQQLTLSSHHRCQARGHAARQAGRSELAGSWTDGGEPFTREMDVRLYAMTQ
jgi:hypothetical protein